MGKKKTHVKTQVKTSVTTAIVTVGIMAAVAAAGLTGAHREACRGGEHVPGYGHTPGYERPTPGYGRIPGYGWRAWPCDERLPDLREILGPRGEEE